MSKPWDRFQRFAAVWSFGSPILWWLLGTLTGGGSLTAALTRFGIPLPQAFFIGAYTAFLIFAFGYTIWRWRAELSQPVTNPVQDPVLDLSKARLVDKKRVKVGDYLDRDWHGRKLKVTLNSISNWQIEKALKVTSNDWTLSTGEDKTIKVAELDIFLGNAVMHSTAYVERTEDGHFLLPQAIEENEDYSSVFAFWNTRQAFWSLSVWVSHISEQQQFADINFSIVVLE